MFKVLASDLKDKNFTEVSEWSGWPPETIILVDESFPAKPGPLPRLTLTFEERKMIQLGNTIGPSDYFTYSQPFKFVSKKVKEVLESSANNVSFSEVTCLYLDEIYSTEYFCMFVDTIIDCVDYDKSDYEVRYGRKSVDRLVLDESKIPAEAPKIFWVKDDFAKFLIVAPSLSDQLQSLSEAGATGFALWKTDEHLASQLV